MGTVNNKFVSAMPNAACGAQSCMSDCGTGVLCPILARVAFRKIPALYQNKSSLKRNGSCIGFIVLIPEQLLHFGKGLQKIRPIIRWYSSARLINAYA